MGERNSRWLQWGERKYGATVEGGRNEAWVIWGQESEVRGSKSGNRGGSSE